MLHVPACPCIHYRIIILFCINDNYNNEWRITEMHTYLKLIHTNVWIFQHIHVEDVCLQCDVDFSPYKITDLNYICGTAHSLYDNIYLKLCCIFQDQWVEETSMPFNITIFSHPLYSLNIYSWFHASLVGNINVIPINIKPWVCCIMASQLSTVFS